MLAEACAMQRDEQVAAACKQSAEASGTSRRVKEQAANFRAAFKVGGERQGLVAEGFGELRAGLGERAQMIGVEGLDDPDLAEDLAGALDRARLRVLEHEQVEIGRLLIFPAAKAIVGTCELGDERMLVGGQAGETAAGELGHLVDRGEILAAGRADQIVHTASLARRRMVSAESDARSFRLSTI